jgi:tetratricopeptide (TPR) repeat protein
MILAALLLVLGQAGAPPDTGAAYAAAMSQYRAGQYQAALHALRALVEELDEEPDIEAVRAQRVRALLRLAHAESTLGNAQSAREAMERALRADPNLQVDPGEYSPSYRRQLEEVRHSLGPLPAVLLPAPAPLDPSVPLAVVTETQPLSVLKLSAAGSALIGAGLAGFATYQGVQSHRWGKEARGLVAPGGALRPVVGAPERYRHASESAASSRRMAYAGAAGAAVAVATAGVLAWMGRDEPALFRF